MMRHARVPDMCDTQLADAGERLISEVSEFADAIFLDRAPRLVRRVLVSEQARHDLVDDRFGNRLGRVDLEYRVGMVPVHTHSQRIVTSLRYANIPAVEARSLYRRRPVVDDDFHITLFGPAIVDTAVALQADCQGITVLPGPGTSAVRIVPGRD